jgi:hypothetical protein
MMASLSAPAVSEDLALSSAPARRARVARLIHAAEWLVLLAAIAYIGGRALPRAWLRLNTDFPNYYLTARLLREGYSTNRLYEWIWLQRQKDHVGITRNDQPVVGFVPDTPFSALVVWPLTSLSPLQAKRTWIVLNLLLLGVVALFLRGMTQWPWRRIALPICVSFPLLRNLEYGQYYLLLLLLVTVALWLYLKDRSLVAGVLMGIAGGLKIFPAVFFLYFLRKRDLPAAIGVIAGVCLSVAASLLAFGIALHRTYFTQVLPWALRGEILNPYSLSWNSLSSLLHKLFIFEPQWNPHPALHAPAAFAVLLPLLQMLVLAPALYLISPNHRDAQQIQLEWSAFLVALLAISTLPASYHFTLLILPITVLATRFLCERNYAYLALLGIFYLGICFPAWPRATGDRWWALVAVPRLYFVLLLCSLCYITLFRREDADSNRDVGWRPWAVALTVVLVIQIVLTLRHTSGVYHDDRAQVITTPGIFLATQPVVRGNDVGFIGMRAHGYFAGDIDGSGLHLDGREVDQLSQTSAGQTMWIEEATTTSQIVRLSSDGSRHHEISDAEFPLASPDGRWLAYLRSTKGRNILWLHSLIASQRSDVAMTPPQFDVEEMTLLPDGSLIFAAMKHEHSSALYVATQSGSIQPLNLADARYPAASPNGRWLAYSQLEHGVWNLWLRDLRSGSTNRLTSRACNDLSSAWARDSKTLLYASDCGRALWFTALYRRQVVP